MLKHIFISSALLLVVSWPLESSRAQESSVPQTSAQATGSAKPIPPTRAKMLEALEVLKQRTPRIPLPPESAHRAETPGALGVVNNGLMRNFYLPEELRSGSSSRQADPAMRLDNEFSVELFWIVSRVNNCHYCLGHQEAKLKSAGMTEDKLLALDTNWKSFPAEQQAAFDFAHKLTFAPHAITDADVAGLEKFFPAPRVLEIAFLVARYNSTNRWTDSLGIPQEDHRAFESELTSEELARPSQVTVQGFPERPTYSDYASWKKDYDLAARRRPRLKFGAADAASGAESLPAANASGNRTAGEGRGGEANYERLLASFPVAGVQWIRQARAAQTAGTLPAALKPKISYVCARADHAWAMQHSARQQLLVAGLDEQTIFSLGNAAKQDATNPEQVALAFAHKLTARPQEMSDRDIEALLVHFNPNQVAEIVYHVGLAAFLDRITEAAGLSWME